MQRLGLDYADLILLHCPGQAGAAREGAWKAVEEAVKKVGLYWPPNKHYQLLCSTLDSTSLGSTSREGAVNKAGLYWPPPEDPDLAVHYLSNPVSGRLSQAVPDVGALFRQYLLSIHAATRGSAHQRLA
jgi:hypothetical protein